MSAIYNLILLAICAAGVGGSWIKSPAKTKRALAIGARQFIRMLPFLAAVFVLIGVLEVFVPSRVIGSLMGPSNGILAPIFAAATGGVLGAGPPAASYVMAQFLFRQHATLAAVATFLIAWAAVSTVSLPVEIRLMGARFAWTRWALTLVFSIVCGVLIGWLL
jgi:uncharacterized membrane protein YraQ (UPF0718 family)